MRVKKRINDKMLNISINADCALVMIPHEDDELLVAGNLICHLIENDIDTYVVFATNGDWHVPASKRFKEALRSLAILGVRKENIFFLGYGDSLNSNKKDHLYYFDDSCTKSYAGYERTYGTSYKQDYSYLKNGIHHEYNRKCFENDIYDVITDLEPQVIVCCDYDEHADHRALSICFDVVINRVLKERDDYKPIVLKRFAYCLAYFAEDDYFNINCMATMRPVVGAINKYNFDMIDSFHRMWGERLRIPTETTNEKVCRAITKHKSQHLYARIGRIINSDEVFWMYRTDNIALKADMSVSTGDSIYLNDGMYYVIDDIDTTVSTFNKYLWKPAVNDQVPNICLKWNHLVRIGKVRLFPGFSQNIYNCKILIHSSGRKIYEFNHLPIRGNALECCFDKFVICDEITIEFSGVDSYFPGISEIEVFEESENENKFIEPYIMFEVNGCISSTYYSDKKQKNYKINIYSYGISSDIDYKIIEGNAYFEEGKLIVEEDESRVSIVALAESDKEKVQAFVTIIRKNMYLFNRIKFIDRYIRMIISKIMLRFDVYIRFINHHSLKEILKRIKISKDNL